ncbi:unnamed protein product [Xylocopa violacea]|uniref:Uncharacterized protein n=1 Tax=Xylocopa violacea TaxID=135666 RepID=A0ABP1N480_XYLVO
MCATNSPCRSPPRSRSPIDSPTEDQLRFHHQHPPHPLPYVYYPPPYPHPNPYGPYPYHPGGFYSPPYCSDLAQESKGSSWLSIVLLIFLLVCVLSVVFYRSLSRDTRRRLNARLPTLTQQAQPAKRKKDAIQNYPAEFILYSDITDPLDRDYDIFCEACKDHHSASDNTSTKNERYSMWGQDKSRNEGVIECFSGNKINVTTDISGTFMSEATRSVPS